MIGGRVSPLTKDDLVLIRALHKEHKRLITVARSLSNVEIAKKFNVSATAISDVINFKYAYINSNRE